MRKISTIFAASMVMLMALSGCSLFDLSYDSRSSEYKEDTGAQSRMEAMERRIDRLERALDNRR
jgi:hypothetical protein